MLARRWNPIFANHVSLKKSEAGRRAAPRLVCLRLVHQCGHHAAQRGRRRWGECNFPWRPISYAHGGPELIASRRGHQIEHYPKEISLARTSPYSLSLYLPSAQLGYSADRRLAACTAPCNHGRRDFHLRCEPSCTIYKPNLGLKLYCQRQGVAK